MDADKKRVRQERKAQLRQKRTELKNLMKQAIKTINHGFEIVYRTLRLMNKGYTFTLRNGDAVTSSFLNSSFKSLNREVKDIPKMATCVFLKRTNTNGPLSSPLTFDTSLTNFIGLTADNGLKVFKNGNTYLQLSDLASLQSTTSANGRQRQTAVKKAMNRMSPVSFYQEVRNLQQSYGLEDSGELATSNIVQILFRLTVKSNNLTVSGFKSFARVDGALAGLFNNTQSVLDDFMRNGGANQRGNSKSVPAGVGNGYNENFFNLQQIKSLIKSFAPARLRREDVASGYDDILQYLRDLAVIVNAAKAHYYYTSASSEDLTTELKSMRKKVRDSNDMFKQYSIATTTRRGVME